MKSEQEKIAKLTKALELHLRFLDSLQPGWVAHIVVDIGLLNQAYIATREAGVELPNPQSKIRNPKSKIA